MTTVGMAPQHAFEELVAVSMRTNQPPAGAELDLNRCCRRGTIELFRNYLPANPDASEN